MAKKLRSNHYLASPAASPQPGYVQHRDRGYWTDGDDSQRDYSDRNGNGSEYYMVANERAQVIPKAPERKHRSQQKKNLNKLHASSPNLRGVSQDNRASSAASNRSVDKKKYSSRNNLQTPGQLRVQQSPPEHYTDNGSDIYVTSAVYKAPSEISRGSRYSRHTRGGVPTPSHYSYRYGSPPSEVSVKSKISRKNGVIVETMSAPSPFCPNTKGFCCLLLLINLGLILITLGFVIVMQFFEPVFVWVLGIVFLVFGFLALNVSLIYCVSVCKDAKSPKEVAMQDNYWTHHWQKKIQLPEIHYKSEDKLPEHDRYSDRHSVSKYSAKSNNKINHARY